MDKAGTVQMPVQDDILGEHACSANAPSEPQCSPEILIYLASARLGSRSLRPGSGFCEVQNPQATSLIQSMAHVQGSEAQTLSSPVGSESCAVIRISMLCAPCAARCWSAREEPKTDLCADHKTLAARVPAK